MAPIRYSLHYEDYSEHLMSRFGKLLQMQSLVDMTLMCSSHTLRVHKAVLAASSAYFQEVLQKQSGEPLIILKMRFSVLKSLVEFMYCGKTQCLEENLDELVSAAQFLKIKGLSKVTKEGLGINNHTELPVFTPPVVINRPPQSLIDSHIQDSSDPKLLATPSPNAGPQVDSLGRTNKDMVVRIPFDIENGGNAASGTEYGDTPRVIKPRRGRPNSRTGGWEGAGPLGRAAERALMRREQDSRKAIHQLKHLQTRHMQDYMDRVTLSQAVNSICGPESSAAHNYIGVDNDLMYMDQTVSSNVMDSSIPYSKEHTMRTENIASSYASTSTTNSVNDSNSSISNAMSQYVDALKSAGLPTDLPILFESGDGSYINVNEQVLLDMVQSSEIQYEVIEQPNIIEKVADPSEIKSIDDLSKSIGRGDMIVGNKDYASTSEYDKEPQYNNHEDAINSLNAILPDNLESFAEQQNYVILDPRLQNNNNSIDHDNAHDFSCIDGDMQFFTKSMSDDVKKYYQEQHLNDARVIEQLCPTSTSLDTNFGMSLLDGKSSHLDENMGQQYNLNPEDLRRNEDCYDFGLQLPQTSDFKEDTLECLMTAPKQNQENNTYNDSHQLEKTCPERDQIIHDLMKIEENMSMVPNNDCSVDECEKHNTNSNEEDFDVDALNVGDEFVNEANQDKLLATEKNQDQNDITASITSSGLQWDKNMSAQEALVNNHLDNDSVTSENENHDNPMPTESEYPDSVIDLTAPTESEWGSRNENNQSDKENEPGNETDNDVNATLDDDIPYAVGLLPLKQTQPLENISALKRRNSLDDDLSNNVDAKCLKRKVKYKKL